MLLSTLIWKTEGLGLPGSSLSALKPTSWKNVSSIELQRHHEHSLVSSCLSDLAPKNTHKCKVHSRNRKESCKEWSVLNSDLSLALEGFFWFKPGFGYVEWNISTTQLQFPHSKALSEKTMFLCNSCAFSSHYLSKLLPGSITVALFW